MSRQTKSWSSIEYIIRKGKFAALGPAHKAKPLRRIMKHMAVTLLPRTDGAPTNLAELQLLKKAWRKPLALASQGQGRTLTLIAQQYGV